MCIPILKTTSVRTSPSKSCVLGMVESEENDFMSSKACLFRETIKYKRASHVLDLLQVCFMPSTLYQQGEESAQEAEDQGSWTSLVSSPRRNHRIHDIKTLQAMSDAEN